MLKPIYNEEVPSGVGYGFGSTKVDPDESGYGTGGFEHNQ
jgi:hypothetical protein